MAYQIKEETLRQLQDVTIRLHGRLVASPLWVLIKDEQIIIEFINVLRDIESQCKAQNNEPEAPNLYEAKG